MDYKSIRPSQVLLDSENPRLPDGTTNDREAINRLLAEGYEQLIALARDLAERGQANPTELPIVLKHDSKYIVLEGNRRFAALRLLGDPKLADDAVHRAAFERVAKKGKQAPKSVYCAVAASRDEADHWITLRHTGANDGVGVRGWSAEQNARHRRRMKAPIDSGTARAISVADELTETYQADDTLVELIKKVRAERLTNIGRFFSGVMLSGTHLQLKQSTDRRSQILLARHTAVQLHDFFVWAFQFLDNNSVDTFKNDILRRELLKDRANSLPVTADLLSDYVRLADYPYSPTVSTPSFASTSPSETDVADSRGAGGPPDRPSSNCSDESNDATSDSPDASSSNSKKQGGQREERFLYSNVKLPNLSPNIQRLLKEAKQLRIDDNYATACVLARVILELAVSDPKVLKWSGKNESDKLEEKIRGCILRLDPHIDVQRKRQRQDLVQANLETNQIGVTYLHQFVHNPWAKSDQHLARRFSSAFSPLLNSVNEMAT
ncbi:MAG: hypothetical protein KF883_00790 [Thermomicrobiales bacterium]|nr:hypothetical protein [Thermomicrobiales bacterium]